MRDLGAKGCESLVQDLATETTIRDATHGPFGPEGLKESKFLCYCACLQHNSLQREPQHTATDQG